MKQNKLKIVFFGSDWSFSTNILKKIANEHEIAGIVESSSREENHLPRFKALKTNLIKIILKLVYVLRKKPSLKCLANRIKAQYYFVCEQDLESFLLWIRSINADIGCIASFDRLLKPEIFNLFPQGVINCHPSLLPKYRGPNPLFWYYFNMDNSGGVTIHYVDKGEDTGDILYQEEFTIPLGMTIDEMTKTITDIGGKLMLKTLNNILYGKQTSIPQILASENFRARKVGCNENLIDWENWPIERVWHFLMGTERFLDTIPPPPVPFRGLFVFQILEYEKIKVTDRISGKLSKDSKGWYITHFEGKIRLRLKPRIC